MYVPGTSMIDDASKYQTQNSTHVKRATSSGGSLLGYLRHI